MATYLPNAGAKSRYSIHSYFSAQTAYHDAHRGRGKGKIANNTWIETNVEGGGGYSIILHRTPIVTYHPDGGITLRTGGFETVTTKARMNEVLPQYVRVSQEAREWYVYVHGERRKFFDGMRIETGATTSHSGGPHEVNPDVHIDIGSHNRRVRKNPGKFNDTVEELLYGIDHDQTVGDVHANGYWYGLVSGLLLPEAKEQAEALGIDAEEFAHDAKEYDWPLNAIITEDDSGFIEVYPFKLNKQALASWRKIIRDFDTELDER